MSTKTVLLIEPESDACHRVEKALVDAGYTVVALDDAERAPEALEHARPDVVIAAYPLGRRAVDDVPALVRASSRPAVPVVAMFPFPQRAIAVKALADGYADVIPKPVDRLLLEDMLRHVIEPPRLTT